MNRSRGGRRNKSGRGGPVHTMFKPDMTLNTVAIANPACGFCAAPSPSPRPEACPSCGTAFPTRPTYRRSCYGYR